MHPDDDLAMGLEVVCVFNRVVEDLRDGKHQIRNGLLVEATLFDRLAHEGTHAVAMAEFAAHPQLASIAIY
jgi:acid stress-induced BolA-like protein IbaG/YrbA